MKVSIVIPTFNHLEDSLIPCLESIIKYTDLSQDKEIVIVANGCTDGTREYIIGLNNTAIKLLWHDRQLGYSKAINDGIKNSTGDIVVLLNNDIKLLEQPKDEWLKILQYGLTSGGIAGPSMMWDAELKRHYMMFFCVAIKRHVVEQIGLLDENFGLGYCEDIDYCIRATNAGWQLRQVPDDVSLEDAKKQKTYFPFPIYHIAHTTYGNDRIALIETNKQYLKEKWGSIENNYYQRCIMKSDINEHLPILYEYAKQCHHITEMGVRHVNSTYAFLQGKPQKLVCYDIEPCPLIENAKDLSTSTILDFKQADVLTIDIDSTDFLFIDTFHTGTQLLAELNRHSDKVRKYIGLHDTEVFKEVGEIPGTPGLQSAIEEFLSNNKEWHIKEQWTRNNGLTILERKNQRIQFSIVIPTFNHLDDCLKPCIDSLIQYTNLSNFEVIIVANGCTDGTREYINSLGAPFKLIWLENALGYTISTNIGIKACSGEYIILLNNDVEFLPQPRNDWLNKLLSPFKNSPKMGATGPLALFDPYAQERILIFFCVMIKKEVFETIGYLDEIFSPGGGEDIDFTMRLIRAGYEWQQVPSHAPLEQTFTNTGDFGIYHKNNKTFGEMPEYSSAIIKRNGLINLKRYVKNIRIQLGERCTEPGVLSVSSHSPTALLKMSYDKLEFDDATVSEIILMSDVSYHNDHYKEWNRVLKSDGVMYTIDNNGRKQRVGTDSQIYDCFIFCDELDLLELRLEILNDVVDKFVLVESPRTHSNKLKPLYFAENKERFSKYLDKIIHIVADDIETADGYGTHWQRERDQRNAIVRGLVNCSNYDIIILSDVDEIPNPEIVSSYRHRCDLGHLKQSLYYYYFNCKATTIWDKARIFPYTFLLKYSPQQIRENLPHTSSSIPFIYIENGGWHFSYLGGVNAIQNKLNSFSHQELNLPEINNPGFISNAIENGKDLYNRAYEQMNFVEIDDTYPELIYKNTQKYRKWIRKNLVYDCFPFFNELDILEIRLNELENVVDYFVICELPVTHKGDPKPLYFAENQERFKKWEHKILYICPTDYPTDSDPWSRERFQRDACMRLLVNLRDNDIIICSDVDEIPKATAISSFIPANNIQAFEQRRFNYYLNLDCGIDEYAPGVFSKITTWEILKTLPGKLCQLRYSDCSKTIIPDAGWHFSYMGGVKHIIHKLESWAHQEWNLPEYKSEDFLKNNIINGIDPLHPEKQMTFVDIPTWDFPQYVVENVSNLAKKDLVYLADNPNIEVTAYISTKDRYFTTLPLAIMSVINQTYKVSQLIIFDDGEHKDLRELAPYKELFALLNAKGINWHVCFAGRIGQVANHNAVIESGKSTEWLWRIDDDDVPEPDCLELLVKNIKPDVGAVGGLVHMPSVPVVPEHICSGNIQHIYSKLNLQWSNFIGIKAVDHLHNTFLYRKSASIHGYNKNLSPVGHREETLFTLEMKLAGWKILIEPRAKTWHLRDPNGGIRSHKTTSYYQHDESVFQQKLSEYNIIPIKSKLFVLNNGIGDHYCFKMALPELRKRFSMCRFIIAVCYPEVFAGEDADIISIADAKILDSDEDKYSIYKWCWDNKWDGSKGNLVSAFIEMYSKI